jgi:hypothetical protein
MAKCPGAIMNPLRLGLEENSSILLGQHAMEEENVLKTRPFMVTLLIVLMVCAGTVMYRWNLRSKFADKLSSFELTITRQGMPGEAVVGLSISSNGSITRFDELRGERRSETTGKIGAGAVASIRNGLKGLWNMSGDFNEPFWNRTTAANYLSINLILSDGNSRSIWLSNVNPGPTRKLISIVNSVVPVEFQLHYKGD